MLGKLPGWVIDDVTSVRDEALEWAALTPAERWRLARLCSKDALWAVRVSSDPRRILEKVDCLPRSSIEALERLRRQAGWRDGAT